MSDGSRYRAPATMIGIGFASVGAFIFTHFWTKGRSGRMRAQVVSAALSQVGKANVNKYWLDVLETPPPYPKEWCGAFALWALHQAGLAKAWKWVIGKGFLYRLPITKNPKPGDIAYFNTFQHHAIVQSVDAINPSVARHVHLINGNGTGGVVSPSAPLMSTVTAFYSIAALVGEL